MKKQISKQISWSKQTGSKKHTLLSVFLTLTLMLAGCAKAQGTNGNTAGGTKSDSTSDISASAAETGTADTSDLFTDQDYELGYDEEECILIRLNGSTASCESDAVRISGSTITIPDEGTYLLSGTLDDGQILVNADKTDKIRLILDDVSIHTESSAPIYVLQADKVFVTLAPGTANTLSNGGQFTVMDGNNLDAVIFSKEDLTLNGEGSLTIESPAGHGVVSKDDLAVTGGTYTITAASHALSGKDSVRVAGGEFTLTSGKDGIHAENADDASLGFVHIAGGTFAVTANGDGISASGNMQIDDGSFRLSTGGGAAEASAQNSGSSGRRMQNASTEDTISAKGIKASGDLVLNGGIFTIDSADDALHSNANLTVGGGTYGISTGDDGLHADAKLTIAAGAIDISGSYEGIEGLSIDITGGDITLTADDDGLNAAGGRDESGFGGHRGTDSFAASSDSYIHISGGTLYVIAGGDGIDSNGSLTVSGGQTFVSGPDNGGNGALDFDSSAEISGGVFLAAGSSQMAQSFGSSSTQGVMMVSVGSQAAGDTISLLDEKGRTLVSWTPEKAFDSVVVSCPEIVRGSSYTLTAGAWSGQITMDSLVYGSGSGMSGMGNPDGGMGNHPGGKDRGTGRKGYGGRDEGAGSTDEGTSSMREGADNGGSEENGTDGSTDSTDTNPPFI